MNIKSKLLKLASMLVNFASTEILGVRWIHQGELTEGVEVFIETETGDMEPVADGEYITDDMTITVRDGKVETITIREEDAVDPEPDPEPKPEPTVDPELETLRNRVTELEGLLQDRDAIVSELTRENEELKAEIENLRNKPVEEPVKMSKTPKTSDKDVKDNPALKYFK